MLRDWAAGLAEVTASPETVALHVADTVSAFLAGRATGEGRALASLHAGRFSAADQAGSMAAITRLTELDDIDLVSCITPGSAVVPVALAVARHYEVDPANWPRAIAAGYAAGMQFGAALGGANILAAGIWPSVCAAPIMASVTAGVLLGLAPERLAHAMGMALGATTARIGRPAGSPAARWYLFGTAVANGLRAAEAAAQGFNTDLDLLGPDWLMLFAGRDNLPGFDFSAPPPSIARVGFKPFATARQCANALWALRQMLEAGLDPAGIDRIEVFVPPMNAGLLQRPLHPGDRLSTLSNGGIQAAIAALMPDLLFDTDRGHLDVAALLPFAAKVTVIADDALDAHLPTHWAGRVVVTSSGRVREATLVQAPFDADALDLKACLDGKWHRLPASDSERQAIRALAASTGLPHIWPVIEPHLARPA